MYSYLKENFDLVEAEITQACAQAQRHRSSVQLITVTKTYPTELLQAVLDLGYSAMGENRPQEIFEKAPQLKGTAEIHLIGQLQTNKVNKVLPLVSWIHSVDREKLLNKIVSAATQRPTPINILIQVNTSAEESKSGCLPEETLALCTLASKAPNVELRGLMTIGPLGGTKEENAASFRLLAQLGTEVHHLCKDQKCELSMGMSGDFPQAIAEGATMIRVGSKIVGARYY